MMDPRRKFGFTLGGIFAALALLLLWRHRLHAMFWVSAVAAPPLLLLALVAPGALVPVERAWQALAHALGWVNTRILLAVVYFLVFAPIALALRIAGKDPLERRRDPRRPTYWRTREPDEPDHLTRPY